MRSTWLVFAILSTGITGCGPGGGHDGGPDLAVGGDMAVELDMRIPDDAKVLVTFTMFAQDYAKTLCAHYVACGQLDAAQMAACVERNLRHTGWDQDIEISKGRMEINELQCLDALKNARCDNSDTFAWHSRCQQFLYIPHQTNGAACLASDECLSGFCQHAVTDGGTSEQVTGCPGTCADPKTIGAPCRLPSDCAIDSFCDIGGTYQCQKLAALNEPCQPGLCQLGLTCPTFPATAPATCQPPVMQTMLDGPCDPFQGALTASPACPADMYCQLQYSGTTPSGGLCKMKLASGADCDPKNDGPYFFVDSQCVDGTTCYQLSGQTKPTCQAFGSAGSDCNKITGTVSTCKQALWCDMSTTPGKCKPFVADGQACGENQVCASALPNQPTCIAANADAGTFTTCQVAKSFGATCIPVFEDSLCPPADNAGTSTCVPTGTGGGVCAPKCN